MSAIIKLYKKEKQGKKRVVESQVQLKELEKCEA